MTMDDVFFTRAARAFKQRYQCPLIVGLGKSGLSCARYLTRLGVSFKAIDTRDNPPDVVQFQSIAPDASLHTGSYQLQWLAEADVLIVSPGIAISTPEIAHCRQQGTAVIGDIELFAQALNAQTESAAKPVVAITGSNGKSTVTTLMGELINGCGFNAGVGGNIGFPALDLLTNHKSIDVYVLELSSFQLETTDSLRAKVATTLNISEDHMDRYDHSLAAYTAAKQRIYQHCAMAVWNSDDPATQPNMTVPNATTFTQQMAMHPYQYGLSVFDNDLWLFKGKQRLLNTRQLRMSGMHNYSNALVALALGEQVGLALEEMLQVLPNFSGLAHRCQWVAQENEVTWINDSKATNVGATLAAISGVGADCRGKIILIAGGDGKGADFSPLCPAVAQYVSHTILLGRDAQLIADGLNNDTQTHQVSTLEAAITLAHRLANPKDVVLLAPACASTDMFTSFEARGDLFAKEVRALLSTTSLPNKNAILDDVLC